MPARGKPVVPDYAYGIDLTGMLEHHELSVLQTHRALSPIYLVSDDAPEPEPVLRTYPPLGYLWVYEPDDIAELTLDEVHLIWEHREQLCGSREAAAEVLAIIEVATGIVETYQGWLSYMDRKEIQSLVPNVEPEAKAPAPDVPLEDAPLPVPAPAPASVPDDSDLSFPALTRQDLYELSEDELKDAWERRPESFASLEAACGALALLRARQGIAVDTGWQALMRHSEILKLVDELPDRDVSEGPPSPERIAVPSPPPPSVEALRTDRRTRRQHETVVREGQPEFRLDVLANYGGRCCLSGCRESVILEAAHISPYTGPHSNHTANGLCLRVDIHRLFDRFRVSIHPDTLTLAIAPSLSDDPTYQALAGKRMTTGRIPASQALLAEHYRRFMAEHSPSAPWDAHRSADVTVETG
ncbi:HNH endonuclease signature motif containing protein [Halomonas sp. Bachu 37]|uniref:HNH endonuclease n=1 Tax=Halomonas kashgarensis TaxID=3084920 RepID=UPI00321632B6